ncbi:MAG: hypothetical protein AB1450_08375 [Pseudomonadota bacterium]
MEKRIPVSNNTQMPIYVGSNMVPPGETRDFPESQVPPHLRPAAHVAETAPAPGNDGDPLLELLDKPIKEITPLLTALTDDELTRLEVAENAGKTRSTLIAAIAEEKLKRAAGGTAGSPDAAADMDAFAADLAAMGDDELLAQIDVFKADEGRLALVQAEIDKRAAANAGSQ